MPSSFSRLTPISGGGNSQLTGHNDAVIQVVQRETNGNVIKPEVERLNSSSRFAAEAQAAPPAGLGLVLDNYRVERLGSSQSALVWTFYYSNDKFFNLGTISPGTSGVPLGNLTGTTIIEQIAYPALIVIPVQLDIDGDSVPETVNTFRRIVLNPFPERMSAWRIKTTTDEWNANVQGDIADRVGTMHQINGSWWLFNGVTGFRQLTPTNYEVNYEWIRDAGNRGVGIASTQDPTLKVIFPPKVPAGDAALIKGSGPAFAGDTYIRLPYHRVTIGQTDDAMTQPPFLQYSPYTFSDTNRFDWVDLPGDPINAAGGG